MFTLNICNSYIYIYIFTVIQYDKSNVQIGSIKRVIQDILINVWATLLYAFTDLALPELHFCIRYISLFDGDAIKLTQLLN